MGNTLPVLLILESMIINVISVELAVLYLYYTHILFITEMVHVTETTVVIEAEFSHQDVTVTEMISVRAATCFHTGAVDHQTI